MVSGKSSVRKPQSTVQSEVDKKGTKKKSKSSKKIDASSLLSFTVHANPNRVNMGEIDTIERT